MLKIAPFVLPGTLANYMGKNLVQIGYVTSNMDKAIEYLQETYGVTKVFRTTAYYPNNKYMGKHTENNLEFAMVHLGNLQLEIVQPHSGGNPYESYLTDPERPMTFHHFAVEVEDWDQTVTDIKKAGYEFCFEGKFEDAVQFGYIDMTNEMGCMLEFLYNGPAGVELFNMVKEGRY